MKLASDCDTELVKTLYKWSDIFERDGMFNNILRSGEWLITKLLKSFCDAGQTLVDKAYEFLDFTTWFSLEKIFTNNGVKVILGVLLAGALLVLGYTLIINHGEKKPNVLQNVIMIVACVLLIPQMFTFLNTSVKAGKEYVLGNDSKLSSTIISNATVDLAYVVQNGLNSYEIENGYIVGDTAKNGFASNLENIDMIDINEVIEPDDDKWDNLSDEQKKYFSNYIDTDNDGNLKDYEIEEESFLWVDMTSWYYRYNINFVAVWCMLLALAIAQFFIAFKTIRLIYELVVHQCLAYLIGSTDLTNGRRAKMILQTIGSTYLVMFINVVLLKCFMLAFEYITSHVTNGLVQSIIMLVIALAVIDGPNLVERILGIDAGLKSGMAVVGGAFFGARAVAGGVKGIGGLAQTGKSILFGKNNTNKASGSQSDNKKMGGIVGGAGRLAKNIGKGAYKTADNIAGLGGKKGAMHRAGEKLAEKGQDVANKGKEIKNNVDAWQKRNAPANNNGGTDNLNSNDIDSNNINDLNNASNVNDNLQADDIGNSNITGEDFVKPEKEKNISAQPKENIKRTDSKGEKANLYVGTKKRSVRGNNTIFRANLRTNQNKGNVGINRQKSDKK
ncbi:MAG: pLS20_p028 family conjugation system transmembrane protein [Acutalibacteraceae bacterium]